VETPIAQATGRSNYIVNVFEDRVEVRSGWQGQNREKIPHREISSVGVGGLVNCVLTIQTNEGRVHRLERLGLREANQIKAAIERQKQKAGLYSGDPAGPTV
jgi:hypothetical protein